jgi:hypothetical protein
MMPGLLTNECYQHIKHVPLGGVLPVLDKLKFVSVGQSSPGKYQCDVSLRPFPLPLEFLITSLNLGGETARAVVRKLAPRQSIPPHTDKWMAEEADWRRFQVPLVTDPSIIMRWPEDGHELHLAAGELYEVRFDRTHEVINGWDGERLHLQIDQVNATI